MLGAALKCPVLLMVGLRVGEAKYDIYVEPIADSLSVPRKSRAETIGLLAQDYADRLARYCAIAPYQWFNFYDFWDPDGTDTVAVGKVSGSDG